MLTAHHAATNSDCPSVHLNSTAVTVDAGAKATISGTATMENTKYPVRATNITAKVDGKTQSGAAAMNGSGLTVTTGALAAGTHTVTIDVSDDARQPHARLRDRHGRKRGERLRGHCLPLGRAATPRC